MSSYDNPHDHIYKVILPPYLRAWFDRERSWHKQKVRIHAETRWVADGSKAVVAIFLAGEGANMGPPLESKTGKISKGRLVGSDGANGIEHALEWKLPSDAKNAEGLLARVSIPDYKLEVDSSLLQLDLLPYSISG